MFNHDYLAVVHVLNNCNELNIFIFIHHTLQQCLEKKELQNVTLLYKIVGNHRYLQKINTKHVLNQFCVRMFYKPSFFALEFIGIQYRFLN